MPDASLEMMSRFGRVAYPTALCTQLDTAVKCRNDVAAFVENVFPRSSWRDLLRNVQNWHPVPSCLLVIERHVKKKIRRGRPRQEYRQHYTVLIVMGSW